MSLIEILREKLEEQGLDPDNHDCPVINAICPYRKNYKCKYTRLERAILMLDCAVE